MIPASILHRTSKPIVPRYSPNIKAFHSDRTVAVYQFGRNLVMLIATSVSEASVDLSHSRTLLFAAIAAFLLLAEASLLEAQPPKSLLERLTGRFPLTMGGSKKRFNTNIYCGSRFAGYIGSSNGRQFASGYSIPPPITSRLTEIVFDLTQDFTMLIYTYQADRLEAKLAANNSGAILRFRRQQNGNQTQ